MPACAVKHCKNWNVNNKNSNIRYYSIPKNQRLAGKWIDFIDRDNINLEYGKYGKTNKYFVEILLLIK